MDYKLNALIYQMIAYHPDARILPMSTKRKMAESLSVFVEDSINKFIAGQAEHGGNITDRDLEKEIHNETIDLFWYNEANKWKK